MKDIMQLTTKSLEWETIAIKIKWWPTPYCEMNDFKGVDRQSENIILFMRDLKVLGSVLFEVVCAYSY